MPCGRVRIEYNFQVFHCTLHILQIGCTTYESSISFTFTVVFIFLIYFHVPRFSQNVKIYSLHANFEKRVLEVLKYNKNCTNGDSTGVSRVVRLISAVFPMVDDHLTKTQEVIGRSNWRV